MKITIPREILETSDTDTSILDNLESCSSSLDNLLDTVLLNKIETRDLNTNELLSSILDQFKIMNIHLSILTNEEITESDIK